MRFQFPYFLLLLPLVAGYYYFFRKRIRYPGLRFSSSALLKKKGENRPVQASPEAVLKLIRLVSFFFIILAVARPQSGEKTSSITRKGIDIMLVLDTSTSMRALDFKPKNRLDAAREAASDFVKARKNDRIGVVVFSAIAFTQCPLTSDHGTLLDFIGKTAIGMTQTDGTAIGSALITAANRLRNSAAKSKVIILLTDGRNNMGEIDPVTAAKAASALGVRIYTIGAGIPGPTIYPVDDPFFGTRYVQTSQELDLDEPTLMEIAATTGGRYFRATSEEGLHQIYKKIDELEKTEIKHEEYTDYNELFRYFLVPAVLLLMEEMLLRIIYFRLIP